MLLPNLIPGLTAAQTAGTGNSARLLLHRRLRLDLNTEAFRAQGIETTVESGIGRNIFLRGGYTYLDAVVQRSFNSDNEALMGGYAPTLYNGNSHRRLSRRWWALGPSAARRTLASSRPATRRRISPACSPRPLPAAATTPPILEYADANGGNSLLLPNRNLDHGYAKLDLGGSYQLLTWLSIYAQGENLLSQQHIAPIGYPSLPMNFRRALRIQWGLGSNH